MARQKDDNKIDLVYSATLKLVLKTGYGGLKMADIAKEASIATGTLYLYFKNKEELINQLYLFLKQKKINIVLKGYDESEPFYISFKKIWLNVFEAAFNEPEEMIFFEQFYKSEYITDTIKQQGELLFLPLIAFIQKAVAQQQIVNLPAFIIHGQILGPIHEIVKYHIDSHTAINKEAIESYFEMAWRSIRK